jgi:serine phosphatase RsbU (regulator of sigma subunit)
MAAENINERQRWLWPWQRERSEAAVAPAAHAHSDHLPEAPETASHSRDAEMILAVFRTIVLIMALAGSRVFNSDYAYTSSEITLAAVAGIYNIAVGISCIKPRQFGLRRPFIVAMDLVLITWWMQISGRWQLFSLYYIVVIVGALWFRVFGGAVTAAFSNFFFLLLLGLAAGNPEYDLSPDFASTVTLDTGLLFLVGCLVGYISEAQEVERQRRLEDQLLIANYQREIDLSTQMQPLLFATEGEHAGAGTRILDPHLEAGVAAQSARNLGGGDYFDVLSLPGGKTALFIADVSGKSVRAQARLPLLKYALRALAPLYPEPATLLTRLNETLAPDLQPELFIALCCVVLDPQHKTLSWCNAGHIAPLLLPQNSESDDEDQNSNALEPPLFPLETDGPALGMFPDSIYESRTLPWLPGDQLLMFTDGLVDALSYGGSEDGEAQVRHLCTRLTAPRKGGAREEAQNLVDMAIAAFDAATPLTQRFGIAPKTPAFAPTHRDDVTVALIRHRD